MKYKILLLTIITIFTTSNIFAQITWENATTFEQIGTTLTGISAETEIIYGLDNNDDKIYTIEEGIVNLLHSDVGVGGDMAVGTGGIFGEAGTGTAYVRELSDLSELIIDYNDWLVIPIIRKGDTIVYTYNQEPFLKIGTAAAVELIGVDGTVNGYVIMNGHIFVYSYVSADSETRIYDFDIDDLANPTITTEVGSWTMFTTFLDNYQLKYIIGEGAGYFFYDGISWQQIDVSVFNGNDYYNFALSFYGDNNDLCITCLNQYNGDLLQIYTAGLPSSENDILTFSFPEQTGEATINSTSHTVEIEVVNGTNLTNLVATFTLSDMATAFIETTEQESGTTINDFSEPVTYTIKAENENPEDWTVTVTEATVGINKISANKISIFPNPTNRIINIKTQEQINKITISDISGKTILETTNTEIDLSEQKAGTYFLQIEIGNTIFAKKIVVE